MKMEGSSPPGTTFVYQPSGEIFLDIDSEKVQAGNYTVRYVVTEQVNETSTRDFEYFFSF